MLPPVPGQHRPAQASTSLMFPLVPLVQATGGHPISKGGNRPTIWHHTPTHILSTSAQHNPRRLDDLYMSEGHPTRAHTDLHYGSGHKRETPNDPVNLQIERLEALLLIHSDI